MRYAPRYNPDTIKITEQRAVLADAFRDLRTQLGVAARVNFSCCGSCGAYELGTSPKGKSKGYVFWHRQDEESLIPSGGVFLVYGAGDSDDKTRKLGEAIVKILAAKGLDVEWNGDPSKRIWVQLGPRKDAEKAVDASEDLDRRLV